MKVEQARSRVVALAMFFIVSVQTAGCLMLGASSNHSIHYILPDGFRGKFQLLLDPEEGNDIVLRNGRYVIEIPPDGTFKVKTFKPFSEWHQVTAAYKNGRIIRTLMTEDDDDEVALRGGTNSGGVVQTYIIGTEKEWNNTPTPAFRGTVSSPGSKGDSDKEIKSYRDVQIVPYAHYILPDGFRGKFELVLDAEQGQEIVPRDGRLTVEIPPSGTLKVKSFEPFGMSDLNSTAEYKNGDMIPTLSARDDEVKLRGGATFSDNVKTFVIGTAAEWQKLVH